MDKEKILSAMDYVDPALIEAAGTPRGGRRRLRPALAAACLCLALAGTVVAFEAARVDVFGFFTGQRQEGERTVYAGYEYSDGGMAAVPVDAFSEELLADTAECAATTPGEPVDLFGDPPYTIHNYEKEFASLEEAEEYVGFDVIDNPVLEAAEPVRPLEDEGGYCNVSVSARGNEGEWAWDVPADVHLTACYYVPVEETFASLSIISDYPVNIYAMIFTETYPHDRQKNPIGFGYLHEVDSFDQEIYTSPNGLEATIVTMESPDYDEYTAFCIVNGVMLRIQVFESKDALLAVLDGFQ